MPKVQRHRIRSLRHSHKLNQSIRKSLFIYNIWQPRSRSCGFSSAKLIPMKTAANINIGSLNACSVCNKALLIKELIIDKGLGVLL